jgi:WD40 repeat protein
MGVACKWTHDSQRFLLESLDIIHHSPSKIYHYALPFSPSISWLHECYSPGLLQEVKVVRGLPVRWGPCSQTLSFNHFLQSLACWKDFVAVGSISGNISILDVVTGACTSTLSKHTDSVEALTFSLDGTLLVSGSNDNTINLWDIQTGGVVRTFHGHTDWIWSVSISPDCATIASGSGDTTIRLWDLWTGECNHIIRGHNNYVTSVGFSLTNSQLLMSASVDGAVHQWDVEGNQIGPAYPGYGVALSLDGALFISWDQEVATVRNPDSGAIVAELHVANSIFQHCCFSPDGRLVACAAGEIIYIWDITGSDPCLIETFVGHTEGVTSLAFSSPSLLISSSDDKSVKFWQINPLSAEPVANNSKSIPPTLIPIRSISLQTGDGIAISSDSDGVVKIWDILTGLCEASLYTPVDIDSWRDVCLTDGRLIVAWLTDEGICVWDVEKSELLQKIHTSFDHPLCDLRISGDKSKVFCVDEKSIKAWSVQTGEAMGEVKLEQRPHLYSLIVDGSKVWVHFRDSPTQGWDFGTPDSLPIPLSNTSPDIPQLDFIDSTKGWNTGPSRIADTVTGKDVFYLPKEYAEPIVSQWDGQYLVAGYESGEVVILDFVHMLPQ